MTVNRILIGLAVAFAIIAIGCDAIGITWAALVPAVLAGIARHRPRPAAMTPSLLVVLRAGRRWPCVFGTGSWVAFRVEVEACPPRRSRGRM